MSPFKLRQSGNVNKKKEKHFFNCFYFCKKRLVDALTMLLPRTIVKLVPRHSAK
jgi:hypothetical protein